MKLLDRLIGTTEAAKILGVVPSLVRRWVAAEKIPSIMKDGRRWLKIQDVEALKAREVSGGWPRGVKRDPETGRAKTRASKKTSKKRSGGS